MRRYNRIEEILEERGTKKIWLAEKVDVTPSTVSKWCINRAQPRVEMLFRIAKVLEVKVCDLLVEEE
jgi:transcriptional regulator with XRE-family HTH domain